MPKVEPIIVIIKDTREPVDRCLWRGNGWKNRVQVITKMLDFGDYSVQFHERELCIEWKQLDDQVASCVKYRRRNYKEMWQRAQTADERWLIVCGRDAMLSLFEGEYRSATDPHSASGTIMGWARKYHYWILDAHNSIVGEHYIYWICKGFLKRVKETGK